MTKVVYVLVSGEGDSFYEMFLFSLCSLRRHDPDREVEVVMDADSYERIAGKREPMLGNVTLTKVEIPFIFNDFQKSRYLKTRLRSIVRGDFLYLDTDTIICDTLDGIDEIAADMAAVSDENGPLKLMKESSRKDRDLAGFEDLRGVPFFNGGVFFVRDSEAARGFFDIWHKGWLQSVRNGVFKDQPALCQANYETGFLISEISGIWNCQVCSVVGPHYIPEAKIIHYYASFSTFEREVIIPHVKESGGVDKTAEAIAASPREWWMDYYREDRSRRSKMRYSGIMSVLSRFPALFSLTRSLVASAFRIKSN